MAAGSILFGFLAILALQVAISKADDNDEDRFVPLICKAPRLEFECDRPGTRWFYDREDRNCRRFEGCAGNGNNFPDEQSCEALCEKQKDLCQDVSCDNCEECRDGSCVAKPDCVFRDSCRFVRCGQCEECRDGICFSIPGCVTIPSPDACQFVPCGPCQECQDGFCVSIPGCVTLPPADPCQQIQCDPCQTCSNGQCFAIIGCIPPRSCQFPQQCGQCSFCSDGFCQPIPGCVGPPISDCFLFPCPPCFKCFANQCIPKPDCRLSDDDEH